MIMLRAVLFLGGLFYLFMGGSFLLDPARMADDFGLSAAGAQGLSTIRADFTAFFAIAGGALVVGAWQQRADLLLVAAALMGIALAGRALSLVLDGPYEGWIVPMAAEAVTLTLSIIGSRTLPVHRTRAGRPVNQSTPTP